MNTDQPFHDELEKAEQKSGIYLWRSFLDEKEVQDAFSLLNNDEHFPWDLNPVLFGEKMTQHAYTYKRSNKENKEHTGLAFLETLCEKLEERFDGTIYDVFCNRFQDPDHRIGWHSDTYGTHIFVLSLGSKRAIQFRQKRNWIGQRNGSVETVEPNAGDVYFMPLQLNKTHQHRVCSATSDQEGTRISLVFFVDVPKYATKFKISKLDRLRGAVEDLME